VRNSSGYEKLVVILTAFFIFVHGELLISQDYNRTGIWVVRDQLISKDKIDKIIEFVVANEFTDIFVQVRGRGDAYYKSEIVPFAENIKDKRFDPLSYVLLRAHSRGIKVHAWVNVFFLCSFDTPPNKTHLLNLHPEWCAVDDNGLEDVLKSNSNLRNNNVEGIYLSPLIPDVHYYLLKVFEELISNYEVDGLHFDYIRFPNNHYDYNIYGRRIYKEKTGIDPILLTITNVSFYDGFDKESLNMLLSEWDDFRVNSINSLIKETKNMIEMNNELIQFSAAVKPDPSRAKNYYFQDWVFWLENDWLDFAVPMNYSKGIEEFEQISEKIKAAVNQEKIWMGIGVYNQNKYEALTKTMVTLLNGYNEVVFFSYNTFALNPDYYPVVKKAFQVGF
jgi:uncharacterized lipoprotein YddW (UPF0748 family)